MRTWIGVLSSLLVIAAIGGAWLKPDRLLSDLYEPIQLAVDIPGNFGDWSEMGVGSPVITSPDQLALINQIYQETLSRTYRGKGGEMIMLSAAYAKKQGDQSGVHFPEVCYPAQGFAVSGHSNAEVNADGLKVSVRRMTAARAGRVEQISYFVLVGALPVGGGNKVKFAQMQYSLRGYIADGLLLRVSNISSDADASWREHDRFLTDFLRGVRGGVGVRVMAAKGENLMPAIGG